MIMASCSCGCSESDKVRLIYSCSGAADVGQIADLTARRLRDEKFGSMSCLSGIGAGLSGFLESAKAADNIVIDGCPVGCGKKMFENQGLPFTEFVLTQQGLVKGSTPPTPEIAGNMADAVKASIFSR